MSSPTSYRQGWRASVLAGAMFVSTLSPAASRATDESYLRVPDVDGGIQDAGREGAIGLLGWRWVSESGNGTNVGAGRVRSRVCTSLFEVLKTVDGATVPLLLAHFQGRSYGQVDLSVFRAGRAGAREELLTIELTNVNVSGIDSGALDDSGRIVERVSLRFESATLVHVDGTRGSVDGTFCS